MKEISLTQGKIALVDDADYEWLNQWKWCAVNMRGNFYAMRNTPGRRGQLIPMAREILELELEDSRQADHKNHNTLDNRQENLRVCSNQQNQRNRISGRNSSSKFKGVCWSKRDRKWQAGIRINGKSKHLGYWNIEEVAALAYDIAAIREFGDFANLNFN